MKTYGWVSLKLKDNKIKKNNIGVKYLYYRNPFINKISPEFGVTTGGTVVTIKGKYFQDFSKYLQCSFGLYFVPAKFISENTISCKFSYLINHKLLTFFILII